MAIRVLRAGASGYLSKQSATLQVVEAVRKILQGGKYVSASLAERLAEETGHDRAASHQKLSDREFQVLRMLLAGKSLKEIAGELSLSVKTISTFHTRIWEKLGVKNDVELVRYAVEHRLTESPAGPGNPGNEAGHA